MSPLRLLDLFLSPSAAAALSSPSSSLLDAIQMAATNFEEWQFDVSSFMILLGETEEMNYRLMRRSLSECLSAAPVAGLQNYLRSNYQLYEALGPSYMNPLCSKSAPLRNMRTSRTISHLKLLKHSGCTVYRIKPRSDKGSLRQIHWQTQAWVVTTWLCVAAIMAVLCYVHTSTWIGITCCSVFSGWSIILRLLERQFIENSRNRPSRSQSSDSVIFMGPRNSCLVLEGSRGDICAWTGLGVQPIETNLATFFRAISWVGSLLALLLVFIAIPNGSSTDQIAFVALNLLGQANVKVGQRLNANSCMASLEKVVDEPAETRTHVYGFLLRRFGGGKWVDDMNLLPKTDIWDDWRMRVAKDTTRDAKALYEECLDAEKVDTCEKTYRGEKTCKDEKVGKDEKDDDFSPRLDSKSSTFDSVMSGATLAD